MILYYNIVYMDRVIYHCHIMNENGEYTGEGYFLSLDELLELCQSRDFFEIKRIYL